MAKKKAEVTEIQEPILVEDVQETDVFEKAVEDAHYDVVLKETSNVEVLAETPNQAPLDAPKAEEVSFNPKDIVEFYNLKGELRYAPYAYITKRGYTALRKYTKKK